MLPAYGKRPNAGVSRYQRIRSFGYLQKNTNDHGATIDTYHPVRKYHMGDGIRSGQLYTFQLLSSLSGKNRQKNGRKKNSLLYLFPASLKNFEEKIMKGGGKFDNLFFLASRLIIILDAK